jgi:SAM-dependent methyltransferase
MLSIFGRQRQADPAAGDTTQEESLRSHVLPRFVKRIRAAERPTILDLGRLSGGNIEFFGRIGCRLQIEDLLACLEAEPPPAAPETRSPEPAATGSAGDIRSESIPPLRPAPQTMPLIREAEVSPTRPAAATARPATTPGRPGRRPTRHIVLPPRTFHRTGAPSPKTRPANTLGAVSWKSPLPTRFSFDDESFDAIVAWDVIDFYDPESARRVAAEVRRVLKPGGLMLSFFHAKRQTAPARPKRYRIIDESHFSREVTTFAPMPRQVYQNRDIEKMFTGLRIIEQYYLKNGLREILMEKRSAPPEAPRATRVPSRPKPRFRIE